MVFGENDKVLIKVLCQEKGYGATQQPWSESSDRWIIICGAYRSSRCITHAFTTSITSRHVWLKSGRNLIRLGDQGMASTFEVMHSTRRRTLCA